jgi:polyisoprenoid-binding protein YceI
MKKSMILAALVLATGSLFAQKKTTTSATVAFDASTSLDALPKAENKTVIAAIDTKAGTVQFEAAVKNFAFANPTIQEHFNGGNWLNSEKFPTFTFNGKFDDLSKVNFAKDGSYTVPVSGTLTVKDVTKPVTSQATVVVAKGTISATTAFSITLADYSISGVPITAGKVAAQPKITVSADFN